MVEDDVVGGSNNSGQNLTESKKSKNYRISAKSRKLNYQPKLSKYKKAILDKSKISVNSTVATNAGAIGYFTLEAREAFTRLRQAFTKSPILQYFDPECHIQIETNVSGYAIDGVLSQLNFDLVASDGLKLDGLKLDRSDFS